MKEIESTANMSEDSRTIDLAKTASVDMMALNNKVVNMRQVVKRTKVQVINKLCKNISALKKKKGTDEQKTQNLRKAERLIEEIDSIKRLKEDKVSKYSLANTLSFTDVCKTSLSAGPRAMARLADHSLMQKMVQDFRTQHPDWKDLAAYLLVKQTGRRFKTKKQKQSKKHSRSVENINASETMTKAYIQERFGEDGLKKAEQRFERKRKRTQTTNLHSGDADEDDNEDLVSKKKKEDDGAQLADKVREEDDVEADCEKIESSNIEEKEASDNDSSDEDTQSEKMEAADEETKLSERLASQSDLEGEMSAISKDNDNVEMSSKKVKKEKEMKQSTSAQDVENKSSKTLTEKLKTNISDSEASSSDDEIADGLQVSPKEDKPRSSLKKKNECVIKELDIDKLDNDSDVESSENDEEEAQSSSESSIYNNNEPVQDESNMSNRQKKKAKIRDKQVPSILIQKSQKPVSDPFFAGSDDEGDEEEAVNDFDEALLYEPGDDNDVGVGTDGNRSMFYNPQGEEIYRKRVRVSSQSWSSQRGGTRWQRQDRGRGGNFSGQQRGRGMSLRGSKVRGAPRGGSFGVSQTLSRPSTHRMQPEYSRDTPKQPQVSSEKLHPSWEASKKRKAEQSGIQAFKGSKITFDDDD